jgi:hypothetical protein
MPGQQMRARPEKIIITAKVVLTGVQWTRKTYNFLSGRPSTGFKPCKRPILFLEVKVLDFWMMTGDARQAKRSICRW